MSADKVLKLPEYFIEESDDKSDLIDKVNNRILGGWVPHGGVSVSLCEDDELRYIVYAQAITKGNS